MGERANNMMTTHRQADCRCLEFFPVKALRQECSGACMAVGCYSFCLFRGKKKQSGNRTIYQILQPVSWAMRNVADLTIAKCGECVRTAITRWVAHHNRMRRADSLTVRVVFFFCELLQPLTEQRQRGNVPARYRTHATTYKHYRCDTKKPVTAGHTFTVHPASD